MTTSSTTSLSRNRRRTPLACLSCRTRKTRCNGAYPCSMCTELEVECIYEGPSGRRGKHAGDSASIALSTRLELIDAKLEHLISLQGSQSAPLWPSQEEQNDSVASSDAPASPLVVEAQETSAEFFGPSSSVAFLRALVSAGVSISTSTHQHPFQCMQPAHTRSRPSVSKPSPRPVQPLHLPPRQDVIKLIDAYFTHVSQTYPFLQKAGLLAKYEQSRAHGFSRHFVALLNAIFAHSVRYLKGTFHKGVARESENYFRRAENIMLDPGEIPIGMNAVHCLLLLTLYSLSTQDSTIEPWKFFANLIQSSMRVGLHSPSTLQSLSTVDAEIQIRTWRCILHVDRILAMTYGRPVAIPSSHVAVRLPSADDMEPLPELGNHFFIAACQLSDILQEVITHVYDDNLQRSQHLVLDSSIRAAVLRVEGLLNSWIRTLPADLQRQPWLGVDGWNDTGTSASEPQELALPDRSSVIIRLRYLNLRILTHRAILQSDLTASGPADQHDQDGQYHMQLESSLLIIQESAVEIISIVLGLHEHAYLGGAWWFATYYTFRAALALYAVHIVRVKQGLSLASARQGVVVIKGHIEAGIEAIELLCQSKDTLRRIRETLGQVARACEDVDTLRLLGHPSIDDRSVEDFVDLGGLI